MTENEQIEALIKDIADMPNDVDCIVAEAEYLYSKDYRKVKHGKWMFINQAVGFLEPPYGDTAKCSVCEFIIDVSEMGYKFCPNCGAGMRGEKGG